MMAERMWSWAAVLVFLLGLAVSGCSSKDAQEQDMSSGMNGSGSNAEEPLYTEDSGILEGRTSGPMVPVYFEFDSSSISGSQVQRIETNADFIKQHPEFTIRIEGNCDPRGTSEYNIALGERRAQSAKSYLINLGVQAQQLTTVSFGKEKLLLFGHDEVSWAQNRRDDFVIVK